MELQSGLLSVDNLTQYESSSEARRFDPQIHGQLGSTFFPLTKKHIPRRPCSSVNLLRVGPHTERASQISRAKTCTDWAPDWPHSLPQPAKWVNFVSFAKVCHGKFFSSGFLLFLKQQGTYEYYSLTKKSGAHHTSFNHQRSTKSPSPAKYRHVAVFFLNAVFNYLPLEDFSQTNGNRLVGAP